MLRYLRYLRRKIIENSINTVFIHIGKCGGSTVREELRRNNIKFIEKHLTKVKFRKDKKYIIVIRNPIARFVSAFNWRYKLVVEDGIQENKYPGEKKLLEKYKTANNLAESIYASDTKPVLDFKKEEFYIHHITEDIDYYIGEFLSECRRENIIAVLVTETLNDDMQLHFDIEITSHIKENKQDYLLSELAIRNLTRYFEKDFKCIDTLNKMGLLTTGQFEKLSEKQRFG